MNKVPYTKPALSPTDQITKIESKGIKVINKEKALHILEMTGLYRLSPYINHLIKNNDFKTSCFNDAFELYKFDRELRHLITGEIEKIEIAFRNCLTNTLSKNLDPYWYTNSNYFKNIKTYSSTLIKIENEYRRNDEDLKKKFTQKYNNEFPPSWIAFESSSFGIISNLYGNLKAINEKKEIAHKFGLSDNIFASWIHHFVHIRNICAHHSRLWNKEPRIQAMKPKNPRNNWIKGKEIKNNRIYFTLCAICYVMNTVNPKHNIKYKIENLLNKYPVVNSELMGFNNYWNQEIIWN
jgi:abortive infection bacteriophage resistance protein